MRTRSEVWALAAFVVESCGLVAGGDWSKAELIRQAYDRGLISSSVTGGGNARLFSDALEAAAVVIIDTAAVTDNNDAGGTDIATTDGATQFATVATTDGAVPLAESGLRSGSSSDEEIWR